MLDLFFLVSHFLDVLEMRQLLGVALVGGESVGGLELLKLLASLSAMENEAVEERGVGVGVATGCKIEYCWEGWS